VIPAFKRVTGWFDSAIMFSERADAGTSRIAAGRVLSRRMLAAFNHGPLRAR